MCLGCGGCLGWYIDDIWVTCLHCPEGRAYNERIIRGKNILVDAAMSGLCPDNHQGCGGHTGTLSDIGTE